MSAFSKKLDQIEDAIELARGKLATNDNFSYLMENRSEITLSDRADAWIIMNEARDLISDLRQEDKARNRTKVPNVPNAREIYYEIIKVANELIKEGLEDLKSNLDEGLKNLREQVRPKVFQEHRTEWEKLEREKGIDELIKEFMRLYPSFEKILSSSPDLSKLNDYYKKKRPLSPQEHRAFVRSIIDVESGIQKTYTAIETELENANRLCGELLAQETGTHAKEQTQRRSDNDSLPPINLR